MKRLILSLALLPTAGLLADATTTNFAAGSVAQPWLAVSDDPRAAALGSAITGISEGVASLQSNPSGLDALIEPEIALAHNEWDSALGMRDEYLAFGHRVGDGAYGLSLRYFSFGSFDNRDANGAALDASNEGGLGGKLGYAQSILGDQLHLGAALEASQESLGSRNSSLYTLSLGAGYQLPWGFKLGLAAQDIGVGGDAGTAPTQTKVGLAWTTRSRAFQLDADLSKPQQGDSVARFGAEWKIADAYSLRAGWRAPSGDSAALDAGFSAGAGVRLGDFQLDYAYVPYGDLAQAHRIGATLFLSDSLFGNKIVIEVAGNSAAVKAAYDDGMAAYARKDWYEAKVSLKQVLKQSPNFEKAADINVTLQDIDKKIAVDKSKGMTSDLRAAFAKKAAEAKGLLEKGEFNLAKKKLDEIFNYDPNFKDAANVFKELNNKVGNLRASLSQEAMTALQENDLRTAVLRYRAILKADDEDQEALDRLAKLRPRILQETKKLHRQGIDYYVSGEMEQAISVWQAALDLDPADANGVRHDMEKAKKMLDLRSSK